MRCCLVTTEHKHCACCDSVMKSESIFCSVECAVYSGRFSVKDGWINDNKPIKKTTPKIPWWIPDEKIEEYIAKVRGQLIETYEESFDDSVPQ